MNWKLYALSVITHYGPHWPPLYFIEAPSEGAAVEMYLATHGLLSYDFVLLAEADPQVFEPHLRK